MNKAWTDEQKPREVPDMWEFVRWLEGASETDEFAKNLYRTFNKFMSQYHVMRVCDHEFDSSGKCVADSMCYAKSQHGLDREYGA